MYILIKEDNFFDKYIEILEKVSNSTTKEFNSTLGYNKKYLKAEKKEGIQWFSAPVILLDSIYRKDKNCYPQVFLEKCNFNDDIRVYSDEEYSDKFWWLWQKNSNVEN